MNIVTDLIKWREIRQAIGQKSIGFVPTMGNLHEGHLTLCRRAKQDNAIVIVSIFVNPTQFNNHDDLAKYPRTLDQDLALLEKEGMDYVFVPKVEEIYNDHYEFQIIENNISQVLEGKFRPGHLVGVLTVVMKLLNLVQPRRAYFGEKDFQQLLLIKKMVAAFFMPIEVIACETVRDANNLALSSRNSRLNADQLKKAALISHHMAACKTVAECAKALIASGFKLDYVEELWGRRLAAVWLDGVRLIDNIALEE